LRKTGAKVKFLSCEPLIDSLQNLNLRKIDWVIVGGESGWKARPVKEQWILEIKDKCEEADIPFFFKQWGKKQFNANPFDPTIAKEHPQHAKGGCMVDGEIFRAMPA